MEYLLLDDEFVEQNMMGWPLRLPCPPSALYLVSCQELRVQRNQIATTARGQSSVWKPKCCAPGLVKL